MRVSVCVGEYAKTPYVITDLELRVYSLEELCYCLKENAFLLDLSLLDAKLVDWIQKECAVKDLAAELYPMVRKQGSLSVFVCMILEYTGLYDSDTIGEVERVLKSNSGLSNIERRKKQVDYLVTKGKYAAALKRYDNLLTKWQEENTEGRETPGASLKAALLHNKGVALTGLMEYKAAAECFLAAWECSRNGESYRQYLAAKRAELSEEDYLSFVAERPEAYADSLKLEKEIERLQGGFRESVQGRELVELKEWKSGDDRQKYYEALERITYRMKESYRNSVSE